MSIWYNIENQYDVEFDGVQDTFDVLFRSTDNGNEYVSIPAEYIIFLIEKYGRNNGPLIKKKYK